MAGTSSSVPDSNSGWATSVRIKSPRGVAVDGLGNFYIADTDNNSIRKVDKQGKLTTVAGLVGWGGNGFSGDNGPAVNAKLNAPSGIAIDNVGNIFIADIN